MNENSDTNPVDSADVKPRGNIEVIDKDGMVHFFETEREKLAFLEETRANQG